jgi:hypothetical protein
MVNENILTVRTATQAALFECELKGQLSDGAWENTAPHDHWVPWSDATIAIGENIGRNFYARKTSYNFARKDLLEVVEGRMLGYARIALFAGLDVALAVHTFHGVDCDGTVNFAPDYPGAYWDKKREDLKMLPQDIINAALRNTSYGPKELRKDLRELNKTIKLWAA